MIFLLVVVVQTWKRIFWCFKFCFVLLFWIANQKQNKFQQQKNIVGLMMKGVFIIICYSFYFALFCSTQKNIDHLDAFAFDLVCLKIGKSFWAFLNHLSSVFSLVRVFYFKFLCLMVMLSVFLSETKIKKCELKLEIFYYFFNYFSQRVLFKLE